MFWSYSRKVGRNLAETWQSTYCKPSLVLVKYEHPPRVLFNIGKDIPLVLDLMACWRE